MSSIFCQPTKYFAASDNEMKSDNLARSLAMMEDELKRAEERVKIAEERVRRDDHDDDGDDDGDDDDHDGGQAQESRGGG